MASDIAADAASHALQARLTECGMTCSMSRKGNCRDNALTESRFGSFKNERVYGERFGMREEVTAMAFEYIGVFHNRKRLHSTLGYKSTILERLVQCSKTGKTVSMKPVYWKTKNQGRVSLLDCSATVAP